MWLVRIVESSGEGRSDLFFGPFQTEPDAGDWMNAYPNDENILDMEAFFLNSPVREDGSPNH